MVGVDVLGRMLTEFQFVCRELSTNSTLSTSRYVRCIKPNADKEPNDFNDSMVLDQLRYLGMLDIIRIRREGFPIHMDFEEFVTKYVFH